MGMKSYTVHLPPDLAGDEAAERALFVKDGFCWPALFIPLIWLLWRRLWLVLILYLVAAAVVLTAALPLGEAAAGTVALLFALLFGFEANNLRRWSLDRRGFIEAGHSFGRSPGEAEIRYFHGLTRNSGDVLPPQRSPTAGNATNVTGAAPYPQPVFARDDGDPPVTGLFPEREA